MIWNQKKQTALRIISSYGGVNNKIMKLVILEKDMSDIGQHFYHLDALVSKLWRENDTVEIWQISINVLLIQ